MKKGEYYFQFLTDEEKVEFKKAFKDLREYVTIQEYLQVPFLTFEAFINHAFHWQNSIEGHKYWEKISLREIQEPQTQAS